MISLGKRPSPFPLMVVLVVVCKYCGTSWKSLQSLRSHLKHCPERKRVRNQWKKYPIGSTVVCVISRSPKTVRLIEAEHRRLLAGHRHPAAFVGFCEALRQVGAIQLLRLEGS